jgi:integrase/recombinase XerD
MDQIFENFIREKRYLANVSHGTSEWHRRCLKWLLSPDPTQEDLKGVVIRMRERGLKETGVNILIRGINSYLHWRSGSERKCGAGCTHPRIRQLKEPKEVLPTFTNDQVKRLITWRPKNDQERRLHLIILTLLDTGCRVSEALNVTVRDIDLDNMLVLLNGKGAKQRLVPISRELRSSIVRYCKDRSRITDDRLFATRTESLLERGNVSRDLRLLCRELGFTPPRRTVHAIRHSFAVNYLRRGGSVFHLQKVLGHSTLEMTRRYSNLLTSDIQAVHERLTLLSKTGVG